MTDRSGIPDRLRISVDSDRFDRLWIYDGQGSTLLDRRVNDHATVPAPPTVTQLGNVMDDVNELIIRTAETVARLVAGRGRSRHRVWSFRGLRQASVALARRLRVAGVP